MLLTALSRIERSVGIRAEVGHAQTDNVRHDIEEMSEAIARTRAEIAAIQPLETPEASPIVEVSGELNSIVTTTESATIDHFGGGRAGAGDGLDAAGRTEVDQGALRGARFARDGNLCRLLLPGSDGAAHAQGHRYADLHRAAPGSLRWPRSGERFRNRLPQRLEVGRQASSQISRGARKGPIHGHLRRRHEPG